MVLTKKNSIYSFQKSTQEDLKCDKISILILIFQAHTQSVALLYFQYYWKLQFHSK